jgi:DNA-directed RNA polymerase subunit RPC12/RpoP
MIHHHSVEVGNIPFFIFRCIHCKVYLYAKDGQENMKCPKCSTKINLSTVDKLKRGIESPIDASYIVRRLKDKNRPVRFQKSSELL